MPRQRRSNWLVAGTTGALALGGVLGFAFWKQSSDRPAPAAAAPTSAAADKAKTDNPLASVNEKIKRSVPEGLTELRDLLAAKTEDAKAKKPLSEAEAAQWLETLASLRSGFLKFAPPAKGTAAILSTLVLDRFTVEPSPANWGDALRPVHDIMVASLSDVEPVVRVVGLNEVAKLWAWMPGRSLTPIEERILGDWKQALHQPVIRCLASKDLPTRLSAIVCLGGLPIDEAAAPAIAYLEDREHLDVRKQTLVSFAQRPSLLTEEMLLKRVHDDDMSIRETALAVLKARGLSSDLITLGSLIFHPKPEMRVSVIPQLKERTDIDPVVWLIELSQDPVDAVRIGAVQALASQKTRSMAVNRRLAEMAKSDRSEEVRQAVRKVIPSADETTASLPPLPGSSILNPRAN